MTETRQLTDKLRDAVAAEQAAWDRATERRADAEYALEQFTERQDLSDEEKEDFLERCERMQIDKYAPSSIRPQGSLLSTSPGAALAPVRDTWRQQMLADNQPNCDKFHKKAALDTTGIERGLVDQAGVISGRAEHFRPSGAKGL